MNSLFKKGAFWLLLLSGMASAFAWSGDDNAGEPALRTVQFRPFAQEPGEGRNRNLRNENRGARERPEMGPRGAYPNNAGAQDPRRQGRMTPDERRALRRQIDEAGQDIYRQKR